MQQNIEQHIADLTMIIQQDGPTMNINDLKTLQKELKTLEDKLIEVIDSVS